VKGEEKVKPTENLDRENQIPAEGLEVCSVDEKRTHKKGDTQKNSLEKRVLNVIKWGTIAKQGPHR